MSRTTQYSSHPEIELRAADFHNPKSDGRPHATLLDLLEIYPDRVVWSPKLDHTRLVQHFRSNRSLNSPKSSRLNILLSASHNSSYQTLIGRSFIKDLNFLDGQKVTESNVDVDNTAYWMHRQFGVSPLFFNGITSWQFSGNTTLVRRKNGKRVSLDGMYRFSCGIGTPLTHIWFSHTLNTHRVSTYMIYKCATSVKKSILSCAHDKMAVLLRPLSIDAFLAEDSLNGWGEDVVTPRNELIQYENSKFSLYSPAQVAKAVERLHALSQLLHVIRGHLTDLHERVQFLMKVHQRLLSLSSHDSCAAHEKFPAPYHQMQGESLQQRGREEDDEDEDTESVLESFEHILSKTTVLMRWVLNYNERTGIRINLFFNISTQTDSKINLDIARLTSKIAVSTQKDSSSMITMAAVTMFFLPGTFVSALFSMVFFNTQPDNTLAVSQQAWLFPVVTIPLTIAVFALWVLWQRYRNRADARSLGITDSDGELAPMFEGSDGIEKMNKSK